MSLGQLGTANGDVVKARVAANKLFAIQVCVPFDDVHLCHDIDPFDV